MIDANTTGQIFEIGQRVHDLGDSAIKIGVPIFFALITSLVTWFFTIKSATKNHEHEIIKLDKNYEYELKKLEMNYEKEINKLEQTNQYEINKIKIQIKIKILEEAINIIEEYIIISRKILEYLGYIICNTKSANIIDLKQQNETICKNFEEQISKHNDFLNNMVKASSKLKLIGFIETEQKLRNFSDLIRNENNRSHVNQENFMNYDELIKFIEEFEKRRADYHISINKDFENLK